MAPLTTERALFITQLSCARMRKTFLIFDERVHDTYRSGNSRVEDLTGPALDEEDPFLRSVLGVLSFTYFFVMI